MDKICGVYMIENIVDTNIYIGSSKDVDSRIRSHFKGLNANKHHSIYLQRAFNVYGKDSFDSKLLITCHPDMLLFYEQQFIDQWKPVYNMSGIAGRPEMTDHTKMSISIANKGRKLSVETRNNISKARTGRVTSEETKLKLSKLSKGIKKSWLSERMMGKVSPMKGRTQSDHARQLLSDINKGKVLSAEHKGKISKSCKGRKHSEETRIKMSESARKRWERYRLSKSK